VKLAGWRLYAVPLPYKQEKHWASATDSVGTYALLRLDSDAGVVGVGEAIVKLAWSSMTVRCLAVALEDVVIPTIASLDLADSTGVPAALSRVCGHSFATSLVDIAWWDLRAATAKVPPWRMFGGRDHVPVSWTVTRQPAEAMVTEAATMVANHGFRALKIKGGQGESTDIEVVANIRAAVGADVTLYVDANGAYAAAGAPAYVSRLAEVGVVCVEDPCPMQPDAAFGALQDACPVPILVDRPASDPQSAARFLEAGAAVVSVRLPELGVSNIVQIADLAANVGRAVSIGLYTEATIGSCAALGLSSALAGSSPLVPAESSFFLALASDVVTEPLTVRDGVVALPDSCSAEMIDWAQLEILDQGQDSFRPSEGRS
jgi:L-alanine-DL-glutamate epimerase-like enolase superfamily enzyme